MVDKNRIKISFYSLLWILFYIGLNVLNTYTSMVFRSPIYFIISLFISSFVIGGPLLFSIQYLVSKYKDQQEITFNDLFVPLEIYFTDRYRNIYNNKVHTIITYVLIGLLFVIIETLLIVYDPDISLEHVIDEMIGKTEYCQNNSELLLLGLASYIGVSYYIIVNYTKITTCEAVLSSDTPVEIARVIIAKMKKHYWRERVNLLIKRGIPFLFVFSIGYFGGLLFGLTNSLCVYVTISISICFALLVSYPFIFDIMKRKISLFHKHKKEFQIISELYNKYNDKSIS